MKRVLASLLSVIMIFSMCTAFAEGIDGPMEKAKIKVGINAEFPPFEYYDENGELSGFDIDLMNCIGEKIGFDIEYVDMDFDKLIPAVINGEVACAISAISVTEERDKIIDYSREYLRTNVTTIENGEKSVKKGEDFAIAFREGLAKAPFDKVENPTFDEELYIKIYEALSELSQDRIVEKLIEKHKLNEVLNQDAEYIVEYKDVRGHGSPSAVTKDEDEPKISATSVPCSEWARENVEKAQALEIINVGGNYNYPGAITRQEFCEMVYSYYEKYADEVQVVNVGNPFSDTDNEKVIVLNALGIIKGKSENTFAPNDLLTREEAATILLRLISVAHPDWAATELFYEFSDIDDISDWAMTPIQTICNMGIMKGVGDNRFAPKETYTTEQAITTIVRVYSGFSKGRQESKWEDLSFADKLNANMPVDKNYMFSPLSIKMALMMAANGAEGETLNEILKAIDVDDLDSYNQEIRDMLDKYTENDVLKLNVSNSIWINSDKTDQRFSKDYEEKLLENFDATSDVVTDEDAVSKINGWVNDKTEGKIPTIITEDNKDFWAMLVNAVYFKARWEKEFYKGATKKDTFTSRDSLQTEIDFMNKTGWMAYSEEGGVPVVELPYLTRYEVLDEEGQRVKSTALENVDVSMYLMMSDGSFSPEEALNNAKWDSKYIALSVPKFNIEYSTGLNDVLKTIGINKAFQKDAEFNKMFDGGNMWIDSTIHKTYIKVDEEGTEAAAVTAIGMAGSALPPEPIELKFNRPFTFIIRDNINGEILFMGEYAFAK